MLAINAISGFLINKKPLRDGAALLKAGYFVKYGVCPEKDNKSNKIVTIKGICLQSSNLKSVPHTIIIKVNTLTKNIHTSYCSCIGGANGRCKHAAALLLILSKIEDANTIGTWSCTDESCHWAKNHKKEVEEFVAPTPITDFCCLTVMKVEFPEINDYHESFEYNIIFQGFPHSAYALQQKGRSAEPFVGKNAFDISPYLNSRYVHLVDENEQFLLLSECSAECVQFYYNNVQVDLVRAIKIFEDTMLQNNEEWKRQRQVRITGTTAYNLYTHRKQNWDLKLKNSFFPKPFTTKWTTYGIKNERKALQIFLKKYCKNHEEVVTDLGFIINQNCQYLGFSPDGFLINAEKNETVLLEVKCPSAGLKCEDENEMCTQLKFLKKTETGYQIIKNHTYYMQLQLGLVLCDLQHAILIVPHKKIKA